MANITPKPFSLRAAVIQFGTDNHEAGITGFVVTPTTATSQVTAVNGQSYSTAGPTSWKANITYIQDFETTGSFANVLFETDGEPEEVRFKLTTNGKTYKTMVTPVPGEMGSAQAGTAMATVSLDCTAPEVVAEA